ncbi:hypothetical protein TNCV_2856071 [Trichonephila clavipes]|nr:hypothetical protein TNCV_2856071 [Trichonephila clavipes]
MRARAYYAHPIIRDHWVLRYISRWPDHVVSLKRKISSVLVPKQTWNSFIYPLKGGMKGRVDLAHPGNRARTCGVETRNATTRSGPSFLSNTLIKNPSPHISLDAP